jgi:curved DNA-binding protein CbpA
MSDRFFWELFGLQAGASRRELHRAYRRLARESHPDLYPEDQKPFQELKMIALNEAYRYLLEEEGQEAQKASARRQAQEASAGRQAQEASAGRQEVPPEPEGQDLKRGPPGRKGHEEAEAAEVGFHHEPAYAYYKQGFVHYSRALHGIEALYQSIARYHRIHFNPRDDAYDRFAAGLSELRQAHGYFSRVAEEHAQSIWAQDARAKLARIERFSDLYRRILRNLKGSAAAP